jgi:hypothetical protein
VDISEVIRSNLHRRKNLYAWFKSSKTQRALQILWISLALVFLAVYVSRNWQTFATQSWRISWANLALALFFALLRKFLGGVQWGLISRYRRENRGLAVLAEDLRVYFLSSLATYIPGSVWMVASRVQLNSRLGASVLFTSTGMVYETALFVWASCLVGSYMAIQIFPNQARAISITIGVLILLSLVAIHPSVIRALIRRLGKWVKGKDQLFIKANYLDSLLLLTTAIMVFVVGGVSHFFLARTFYNSLPLGIVGNITSAFALAWTIGYLTPIAPSGLGVRDGILVALFSMWMPGPIAVVVTLVSRLLLALEDVIWAGVTLILGPVVLKKG